MKKAPRKSNEDQAEGNGQHEVKDYGDCPDSVREWENQDYQYGLERLDQVTTLMNLDPSVIAPLRHPKRALTVALPTRLDNGSVQVFVGYRVHHDLALGPGKGGIRFHPNVCLGEVAANAMLMSWKCSLMNLPFGGAHGGIRLDPHALSKPELERITRRYASEIIDLLGPTQDIPGPDLHTNEQTMAWIMDTYSVNKGYTIPSVVTGKPQSIGGSLGLLKATGHGVAFCTRRALKHLNIADEHPTVVIQGIGQVGSSLARDLHQNQFRVLAVSDTHGGIYNPKGIDVPDLVKFVQTGASVVDYKEAQRVTNEELFELKCDVLAPAAVAWQINKDNAAKLNCRLVVEGANAPTTCEADEILASRGITVVPDILANSAGVTMGYFEWVQGLMRLLWTQQEVYNKLDELVGKACDRVFERSVRDKLTLRQAALVLALERILEARRLRGLYP